MSRVTTTAILFSAVLLFCPVCQAEEKVVRLGMIGLDTSHVIAFTKIINDPKNNYGCRVVAGYPGGSPDMDASASRVEKFTEQLRDQFGVEIVGTIEELCEKVDGVLLESVDGRPHLKQARPNVPCWSSSAFRYAEGIVGIQNNENVGEVKGCDVFGSSSWAEHHPDLYLYGIHPVTALFAVMGTGCQTVSRFRTESSDLVVGLWKDGRIGTFRDLRGGKSEAAVFIYGTEGMVKAKSSGYKPLVDEIVRFFKTGKVPVSAAETIEIYAFMSAADESKALNGAAVSVKALIDRVREDSKPTAPRKALRDEE